MLEHETRKNKQGVMGPMFEIGVTKHPFSQMKLLKWKKYNRVINRSGNNID